MGDPIDDAEAKLQRALQDQFEALGVGRRQRLSEDDYKENLRAVPNASALEAQRRINQRGTDESRVSTEVKKRLTSWSTAWTELSNEDAATESLQDINSGQTHRANLALRVAQPSELQYDESGDFSGLRYRVSSAAKGGRARGGGRGGRGGGQIGIRGGRHGPIRLPKGLPIIEETHSLPIVRNNSALRGGRANALRSSTLPSSMHLRSFETSLADPETFMAMARRNRPNARAPKLTTSEGPSVDDNQVIPSQEALARSIRSNGEASGLTASKGPSVNDSKVMPSQEAQVHVDSEIVSSPAPRPTSPLRQADNVLESSHVDTSLDLDTEIANDEDIEKIQQLKDIAARMGGMYLEEILPVIEKLQRRIDLRASRRLKPQNTEEGRKPAGTLQTESAAPSGTALKTQVVPSVTSQNERVIETSPQAASTQFKVGYSPRQESFSSVHTSMSSIIAGRPMLNMPDRAATRHPDRGGIHSRNGSAGSVSMAIKDVKDQVVKVGAIFGEHIHKDHWQPRLRRDSVASSVTSTIDGVQSISANFSRLSLRERSTSRPGLQERSPSRPAATPTTVAPSLQGIDNVHVSAPENVLRPSAPIHTMRDTSNLVDNAITRQYSMLAPSIERSRASSGSTTSTQRDPFAVRFNTAPYRNDQASARITPSNVPRPKIPDFLKDLCSDTAQDAGAAARRQYGGVENERIRLKKDPWNTARGME